MGASRGVGTGWRSGDAGPIRACAEGTSVRLRVVPGARRTELMAAPGGGPLRLRVAAPPVEGKANEAVLEFLAAALGARPRALRLVAGERSRDKVVVVPGAAPEAVAAALGVRLDDDPEAPGEAGAARR